MPTEAEAATLRVGAGVPVLRYTRRHIADTGRSTGGTGLRTWSVGAK
ncbi:hypothetical protein [Streptomyces niveus]